VATFAAYFDDSGTHDDATNVVCGGVAGDSQQMLRLESDWNAVLRMREYDLDYLHMKEMKSGKGKFASFSTTFSCNARCTNGCTHSPRYAPRRSGALFSDQLSTVSTRNSSFANDLEAHSCWPRAFLCISLASGWSAITTATT